MKNIRTLILILCVMFLGNLLIAQNNSNCDTVKKQLMANQWKCADVIMPDSVKKLVKEQDLEMSLSMLKLMSYKFASDTTYILSTPIFEDKGSFRLTNNCSVIVMKSKMGEQQSAIETVTNNLLIIRIDGMPLPNGSKASIRLKLVPL